MVSKWNKKTLATTKHSSLVTKSTALPRMEENMAFRSAQLLELVEMLKQQKMIFEEHQTLIVDLCKEKDYAQNEHSNAMEREGISLTRRKHVENKLKKLKSCIPPKSKKKESSIIVVEETGEKVDYDEAIPFNMSFSKWLVELQVPKKLRKLLAMELYDGSFYQTITCWHSNWCYRSKELLLL